MAAKEQKTSGAMRRRLVFTLALMREQSDAHAEHARSATSRASLALPGSETEAKERQKAHAHAGAAFAMAHARALLKKAMR